MLKFEILEGEGMCPFGFKTMVDSDNSGNFMQVGVDKMCRDMDEMRYYLNQWYLKKKEKGKNTSVSIKYVNIDDSPEGIYNLELKDKDDMNDVFDKWEEFAEANDIAVGFITEIALSA